MSRIQPTAGTTVASDFIHPGNAVAEPFRSLLNVRENDILDCVLSGLEYGEIAEELNMGEKNVSRLMTIIRAKIGCPANRKLRVWLRNPEKIGV